MALPVTVMALNCHRERDASLSGVFSVSHTDVGSGKERESVGVARAHHAEVPVVDGGDFRA